MGGGGAVEMGLLMHPAGGHQESVRHEQWHKTEREKEREG